MPVVIVIPTAKVALFLHKTKLLVQKTLLTTDYTDNLITI